MNGDAHKMNINQHIYDTLELPADEVTTLLGLPSPANVIRKRKLVMLYLGLHEDWDLELFEQFTIQQYELGWLDQELLDFDFDWNPPSQQLPSKVQMAKNFLVAMKDAIKTKWHTVSDEEQQRRHSMCKNGCEFYIAKTDQCSKCGCYTSFKTALTAWHCPIDKW